MKKQIFRLILFTISVLIFTACSDDEKDLNEPVPVTDFELKAPYRWTLSKQKESFYIINNGAEMQKYVESTDDTEVAVNMPDFDKSTLLLASGPTLYGVHKIETKLVKHSDTEYTFYIDVYTNAATVAEGYIVAVTTPRLPANAKVTPKATVNPGR